VVARLGGVPKGVRTFFMTRVCPEICDPGGRPRSRHHWRSHDNRYIQEKARHKEAASVRSRMRRLR